MPAPGDTYPWEPNRLTLAAHGPSCPTTANPRARSPRPILIQRAHQPIASGARACAAALMRRVVRQAPANELQYAAVFRPAPARADDSVSTSSQPSTRQARHHATHVAFSRNALPDSRANSTWKSVPAWCHALARHVGAAGDPAGPPPSQGRCPSHARRPRTAVDPAGSRNSARAAISPRSIGATIQLRPSRCTNSSPMSPGNVCAAGSCAARIGVREPLELGFQPALGQALARAKVERENHPAELVVDLEHL